MYEYSWQIIFFERAGRSVGRSHHTATSFCAGRPATDAGSTGELVKVKRIEDWSVMISINKAILLLLAGAPTTTHALNAFAGPAAGKSTGVKVGRVDAGPIEISEIGFGTWAWGNKLLWDYDPSQDEEIYQSYQCLRNRGVSLFDSADSYGTLQLNGRAEILLGSFERRYQSELSQPGVGADDGGLLGGLFSSKPYIPPAQQVATKFAPYPWRITRKAMVKAARESLERLEQDKLAIAQLHWSTGE